MDDSLIVSKGQFDRAWKHMHLANQRLKTQMQRQRGKVDMCEDVDAGLLSQKVVGTRPRQAGYKESAPAKPHHVNASSSSRNSHKESYGSNDMAHTYFLEKGRKKTQDKTRIPNHKDMASTRAHCTPNAWLPKPRNIYRSFPVSKCSGGMSNVQSPMIRNNNPVEPKNHTHKPGRQIGIGQRFSLNKSSAMHEKPQTPRSCLRAFTASANVPSIYIQLFWNTLTHDAKTEALEITLPWTNIVLKPDLALELGKSISLTETEEEAASRQVHATHPQGKQEMSKRQPELEAQLKELDDNVGDDNEETGAWDDNDDLAEICGSRLVHFITLLIDQDEQSTSTSPTNQEIQSLQVSLSGPVPQFMAPDHSSSGPVLHEMDGLIKSVQTSRPIDKRRYKKNNSSQKEMYNFYFNHFNLKNFSLGNFYSKIPLSLKNISLQQMFMLKKTTMIKQRMHRFDKMNLSILSVHRYKTLLSLPHAILIMKICIHFQPTGQQHALDLNMCMFAAHSKLQMNQRTVRRQWLSQLGIKAMQDDGTY
ncbi:hypothetical protein Tco_0256078 [Tanacetum coccineum]